MKRALRHLSRLLPALLSLGLLAWVLRSADLGRALGLVHSLGWRLPLLLLPNLVAILVETSGWWLSFSRLGGRPPLHRLLAVRVAVDALMLGLPSGSVVSETVQPYPPQAALRRPLRDEPSSPAWPGSSSSSSPTASSSASRRSSPGRSSTGTRWPPSAGGASRGSSSPRPSSSWPWPSPPCAATAHGKLADRLHRGLDRVGGRWLGSWLERNAPRFQRTDEGLAAFFQQDRAGLVPPVLLYELAWFARSVETWLFLWLVGVDVPLVAAMVIETALILVRAMAVPVPAGLGVQDAGYVLCLRALAVPDATTVGAAFVVLKRGKDVFWILLGFLLLGVGRRRDDAAAAVIAEGGPAPS